MFLHAHSEDSDQTGPMPRLIWVFTGSTCHFVGFCHAAAHFSSVSKSHSTFERLSKL